MTQLTDSRERPIVTCNHCRTNMILEKDHRLPRHNMPSGQYPDLPFCTSSNTLDYSPAVKK